MNNSWKRTNELQAGKVGWIIIWLWASPFRCCSFSSLCADAHRAFAASNRSANH